VKPLSASDFVSGRDKLDWGSFLSFQRRQEEVLVAELADKGDLSGARETLSRETGFLSLVSM
jgi:hypothetical protein